MSAPYFMNWCPDLIVRTDIGHSTHADFKQISMMECRAEREGRHCRKRGQCVEAMSQDDGRRVSSKTF